MSTKKKYGIILAGGKATRLYPITQYGISKQLLPVYNKPMIEFPIRTLQEMGVTDILIINADVEQQTMFRTYLGDGSQFNLKFSYIIQEKPNGLAEAFIIGEEFLKDADDVVMILGDNCFIGTDDIRNVKPNSIFTYKVKNPAAYGVAKLDKYGRLIDLVEKPKEYIGEDAVVGLYYFTSDVVEIAKSVKPSARGELEIVDVIKEMHEKSFVHVVPLDSGFWFDCGTHDDLIDCANLVRTIEHRTNKSLGIIKKVD